MPSSYSTFAHKRLRLNRKGLIQSTYPFTILKIFNAISIQLITTWYSKQSQLASSSTKPPTTASTMQARADNLSLWLAGWLAGWHRYLYHRFRRANDANRNINLLSVCPASWPNGHLAEFWVSGCDSPWNMLLLEHATCSSASKQQVARTRSALWLVATDSYKLQIHIRYRYGSLEQLADQACERPMANHLNISHAFVQSASLKVYTIKLISRPKLSKPGQLKRRASEHSGFLN